MDKVFKCSICGKYVSYRDIGTPNVITQYIPDTEFTIEDTNFTHLKCLNKESNVNKDKRDKRYGCSHH